MGDGPILTKEAIEEHVLPIVEAFANSIDDLKLAPQFRGRLTAIYAAGVRDGYQQGLAANSASRCGRRMMTSLPTCWHCPECGNVSNIKPPGAHLNARTWLQCSGVHVESLVFPPGTPLTVILDTLGIEYREGWENRGPGVDPFICFMGQTDKPVLVVVIPATDEAQDG